MVWSIPALGLAVTCISTVSLHPFSDQYSVYVPESANPDTDEVGSVVLKKVTTAGLPASAVQVPAPVAANAVVEY